MFGRNGEAPLPVIAAKSPADCFGAAYQAAKIALTFTTPVILLSDGYLANGAEPWLIPDPAKIPEIKIQYADNPDTFHPYKRNKETLARIMSLPGMPELEHRIGGLEKEDVTGNVSYDSENHDKMVRLRAEKVQRVRNFIDKPDFYGEQSGKVLIISWGSTYGSIYNVYEKLKKDDRVSWCHLNWVNPLPDLLEKVIHNFDKILVPEINLGQLSKILRSEYLVDTVSLNIVKGLPLSTSDIYSVISNLLEG